MERDGSGKVENTVPFDIWKFRKVKPEILVEWNAPNNKSPCREGSPRLLKDKTHRPTSPSGIFSRFLPISMRMRDWLLGKNGCACVIGSWGRMDSILDPRALVFYHVTDGDRGSGELHARVARIWLQGSHRACACFQNHCNDILLRYFVEKLSRRQ